MYAWTGLRTVADVLKYGARSALTCASHIALHLCACLLVWETSFKDPSVVSLECESSAEEESVRVYVGIYFQENSSSRF